MKKDVYWLETSDGEYSSFDNAGDMLVMFTEAYARGAYVKKLMKNHRAMKSYELDDAMLGWAYSVWFVVELIDGSLRTIDMADEDHWRAVGLDGADITLYTGYGETMKVKRCWRLFCETAEPATMSRLRRCKTSFGRVFEG